MSRTVQKVARYCLIAASAAVLANGCRLDRSPILPPPGRLQPAQYCPGDTLVASYDFLGSTPCTDARCADPALRPDVTISSTPALFPPRTFDDYLGSQSFTAAGDRVDVRFDYPDSAIVIPPDRLRAPVPDQTLSATRITGMLSNTVPHSGDCTGGVPVYMPIEVPRLPRYSPNVALMRVRNVNGFAVEYTIPGSSPGDVYIGIVGPGDSIGIDMPGVPASISGAVMIQARPIGALTCPPGSGSVDAPPMAPPLNTEVFTACR